MKIALVGVGAMGLPIARRLAATPGLELSLFDVDSGRLDGLQALGRRAASVTDAARDADAIFTVLPADRHVEAVVSEVATLGRRGLFVDFSTIAPRTIEHIASLLAKGGMETVSVAVTRGTAAAESGDLALFVGIAGELPGSLQPAFDAIASEVCLVGGLGAAKALKIANNIVLSCLDIAICEALVLGRSYGLSPGAIASQLAAQGAGSWALENHIVKFVLPDDLGPGHFSTRHMAKDVQLFVDLALEQGAPALLAGVAAACYRGTIAAGFGDDYHLVVIRWLEAGASSGQVTAASSVKKPDVRALDLICKAVVAVQILVSLDALTVVRRTNIEPGEAAAHLGRGSAANESLAQMAAYLEGDTALLATDALIADLTRVVELANAASVPGLMFEAARHAALAS